MKSNILIVILVVFCSLGANPVRCFEIDYSYQEGNESEANSTEDTSKTTDVHSDMNKKMNNFIEVANKSVNILIMAFYQIFFQSSDLRPVMILDALYTEVQPLATWYLFQLESLRENGTSEEIQNFAILFMERFIDILEDLNANLRGYDNVDKNELDEKQYIYRIHFLNALSFPSI